MINFSFTNFVNVRLPSRTVPTALDKERHFLMRIVGQSMKKKVSRELETSSQSHKRK